MRARAGDAGEITLRLPYREPMTVSAVLDFLGAHAVPGLETYADGVLTRVLDAPSGPASVALSAGDGAVLCRVRLTHTRDLVAVVSRVRRLLDLDADPTAVDDVLGADPQLAPLVRKRAGIRAPGAVDGFETLVRTIVGQQISLGGARTVLGRIVAAHGRARRSRASPGGCSLRPPPWPTSTPANCRCRGPAGGPWSRRRARSPRAGCTSIPESTATRSARRCWPCPVSGPWTADYLCMRAVRDPDVLLASDLVVRRAAAALDLDLAGGRPDWAPWRSYATYHLWSHLYADLWSVTP